MGGRLKPRKQPKLYLALRKRHSDFFKAWDKVGTTARSAGPIDEKSVQLIQLAAAAAIRSEGAVHSHVRRALAAGAGAGEITQALMLLAATIGFPNVIAALSWADDVLKKS